MKRISCIYALSLGLVLLCASVSSAATISFDPLTQNVMVGSTADVPLVISGLGDGAPPSLGAFDLDISYDPSILAFSTLTFGDPTLGDQLDLSGFGSISSFDGSVPGTVNLFELSLDSAADLDSLQAGSFALATLTFDALALGTSPLNISINALGDALGDPLTADLERGAISVEAVPAPCTLLLFGTGLVGIAGLRKKFGKK